MIRQILSNKKLWTLGVILNGHSLGTHIYIFSIYAAVSKFPNEHQLLVKFFNYQKAMDKTEMMNVMITATLIPEVGTVLKSMVNLIAHNTKN